jgi:hypothetical protein
MTGLSGFLDGEIKFIHCDFSKPRIAEDLQNKTRFFKFIIN